MQPECFDEHCVGNLLCDQRASWLRVPHLAQQPLDCPAQRSALYLAFQQDHARQSIEKKLRVAFQSEVTSKNKKVIAEG